MVMVLKAQPHHFRQVFVHSKLNSCCWVPCESLSWIETIYAKTGLQYLSNDRRYYNLKHGYFGVSSRQDVLIGEPFLLASYKVLLSEPLLSYLCGPWYFKSSSHGSTSLGGLGPRSFNYAQEKIFFSVGFQ